MEYKFDYDEINNCCDCPFCYEASADKNLCKCGKFTRVIETDVYEEKPDWCLLTKIENVNEEETT